jgi:choline-sulfatase
MNKPKNILLIMFDQMRHDYLGYRGASWINTPNLDRLAERGAVFTHCVTNSPVCSPARIAFATGLQPHRLGVLNNHTFWSARFPTIYQRFRDYGYWTGFVGKLDLAKPTHPGITGDLKRRYRRSDGRYPEHYTMGFCDPFEAQGGMGAPASAGVNPYYRFLEEEGKFDTYRSSLADRSLNKKIVCVSNFSNGTYDVREKGLPPGYIRRTSADFPLPEQYHCDTYITDKSCEWLSRCDEAVPWFLQVNFHGPHDPFDPPSNYAEKYRTAEVPAHIPADFKGKPSWVGKRFMTDCTEDIAFTRRQYAASVEHLDAQVGRLISVLKNSGQFEDTIIVFTADHGEMLGDFGLYIKHVPYEASVRVPLLFSGAGIKAGEQDGMTELIDVNPTLCEYAGIPPLERGDARSLLPVLRGEREAVRVNCLSCEEHFQSIRGKRWKYVKSYNDIEELYDLQNDPEERDNLLYPQDALIAEEQAEIERVHNRITQDLHHRMCEGMWLR